MTEQDFPPTPFDTVTRSIRVQVLPEYSAERSTPESGTYVYLYTIRIKNEGDETVQLLSRHWIIRDGFDKVEHVLGEGVVGQKPVIPPGEAFTYTSSCPLKTPTGSMKGQFQMRVKDGEPFDVEVGEFRLADPNLVN